MSFNLLNALVDTIVGIVVFVILLALAVVAYIFIKRKMDNNYKTAIDYSKIDGKSQLVKHIPFLWPKELEFYEMILTVLPKNYLIVPKVCVSKIVKPHGSLVLYNAIKDKFVDFLVIRKDKMEPIAVIDCFYPAIADRTIKEIDPAVEVALRSVDIPVLKYEILDTAYNKEEVLKTFLDALDPLALAELRKNNK